MKSFVVLSCVLAVAVASYVPADTPEVAAAKAQHFAAHQQAQARNWASDVVVNNQWVAAAPAWSNVWTARAANWYAPSWQRWYEPAQITVVNGHVQDTPEVAAEKAKHFALVAEANARNAVSGGEDGQWVDDVNVRVAAPAVAHVAVHAAQPVSYVKSYVAPAVSHSYVAAARHVQPANIVVANGHVQDTPEVAAEKAKHFALYAESAARNAAAGSTEWADNAENWKAWGSPAAVSTYAAVAPVVSSVYPSWAVNHQVAPIVVANGHVQDTPEVAAEKAKHLAQVAEAKARNAVSGGEDGQWVDDVNVHVAAPAVAHVAVHAAQPVSYVKSYVAPAVSHSFVAAARHVQPANIVVANGHVQDTAEVAAEKAKHLALVAEAKARNGDWSEVVAPVAVAPVAPVAVAPVAVGRVAHAVAAVPAVADLHSQYHAQDEAGQYTYGYNGGLSTKNEEKTVDGVTRGAYSYVDANGIVQSRSYVADSFGFRVAATDLPQDAPAVAAAPIVAAPVHSVYAAPAVYQRVATAVPAQVVVKADGTLQDTPEVAAAKAQHFAAHQQEHARLAGGAW